MQCSQRAFVETSARLCARFRLRDRKRVSAWEMMKILGKTLLMTVQWTLTPIPSAGFGAGADYGTRLERSSKPISKQGMRTYQTQIAAAGGRGIYHLILSSRSLRKYGLCLLLDSMLLIVGSPDELLWQTPRDACMQPGIHYSCSVHGNQSGQLTSDGTSVVNLVSAALKVDFSVIAGN